MRKALIVLVCSGWLAGCAPATVENQGNEIPIADALPAAKYVFGAEMLESGAHYPIAKSEISQYAPQQQYASKQAELIVQEELDKERQFAALLYRWQAVNTQTGLPLEDRVEIWAMAWGQGATPVYWQSLAKLENVEGKLSLQESRIGEDWIIWYKNEKTPEVWEPDSSLWGWIKK